MVLALHQRKTLRGSLFPLFPLFWWSMSWQDEKIGPENRGIRKKYDVASMWGNIRPRWRLLQQHLETKGPGWYSLAEREERLFTNRSNRPGDDMTDELRTDNDAHAWHAWRTAHGQLWRLRQSAPPLGLPGEHVMITSMYAQVRDFATVVGRASEGYSCSL